MAVDVDDLDPLDDVGVRNPLRVELAIHRVPPSWTTATVRAISARRRIPRGKTRGRVRIPQAGEDIDIFGRDRQEPRAPEGGGSMDIDEAARVFTDPKAYADEKRFHAACARLRRESPVTRVDVEGFDPFWAVTKHADVMEIARQPDRWINAPRPALGPKPRDGAGDDAGAGARADGPAGSPRVPAHQLRLVQAEEHRPAQRARGRAGEALRRSDGGARRCVRFRHRRRRPLPAVRDPLAPRPSRGGFPAHAQAHAGALRDGRPGARTRSRIRTPCSRR